MSEWLLENSVALPATIAVVDWLAGNWMSVVAVVVGIVLCTLAGLLALTPDPDAPATFVPVYLLTIVLFLLGLALLMRLDIVMQLPERIWGS